MDTVINLPEILNYLLEADLEDLESEASPELGESPQPNAGTHDRS